jgi:hypothetical protein
MFENHSLYYVLLLLKELEDVCSQSSLVSLFELAAPDCFRTPVLISIDHRLL